MVGRLADCFDVVDLTIRSVAVGGCFYNPVTDPDLVGPECDHEWRQEK
jgi:hypothetical protein|tara:strand:+ start:3001 stop:3144 length:144 start_codon:yes stop_codon:yes gene_type:complete